MGPGSTAGCSRSPAPSTPAPTRSSATSSPSASSASRGSDDDRSGGAHVSWTTHTRHQNQSGGVMDFAFTEDQLAFRDAVRDLLAGTCPPEAVRAAWEA